MYSHSLGLNLTSLKKDDEETFKIVCTLVRYAVTLRHGFKSTTGMTDFRFGAWPISIRFKTSEDRSKFRLYLVKTLNKETLNKIGMKYLTPNPKTSSLPFVRQAKL